MKMHRVRDAKTIYNNSSQNLHYKTKASARSNNIDNKQDLRASGLSLLPLALRPGLLSWSVGDKVPVFILAFCLVVFGNLGIGFFGFSVSNVSAASLTLTIPNSISLDISPENGAIFKKSDSSTLSVKTDANFGYDLGIKVKNAANSNNLVNGENKLLSISSALSENDFSSIAPANTWGYLPSKLSSSDNTNYQPGPTSSAVSLDKTSSANASDDNNYNITLAAKVDNTLPSGTYKNTFVLTASANTVSYTITYNLNSGSWNGTSPQTGTTSETSVNISSATPSKSNYTFEGWCSVAVTNNSGTNPTCSGTKYTVGGTYNLANGTNNLDLYAMWKSTSRGYTIKYNSNISGASNMPSAQYGSAPSPYSVTLQNNIPTLSGYTFKGWCTSSTSTASCSGTTYQPGNSVTITSSGQTLNLYAMWQSLTGRNLGNLGNMQSFSCSSKITNMGDYGTVTDTRDNNTYTVAKLADNKCWMTSNLKIAGRTLNSSTSDVSSNFMLPSSSTSGFGNYNIANVYVDSTYGGYYTWYAATAGEGIQSKTSGDTSHSICPKGWKLPSESEYSNLVSNQGSANMTKSPANFMLNGNYNSSGSAYKQGEYGRYWASTAYDGNYAYYLHLSSSDAIVFHNFYKYDGSSVRCVARQ